MRIVLVNWSPVWEGVRKGGGVGGYVQALAVELARAGHDVYTLASGQAYDRVGLPPATPSQPGTPRVVRHPDWLGVRPLEIVNSPVLSPSLAQFRDSAREIACPPLESLVARLMASLAPDAVHWHNLEGFSAGCVRAVRDAVPTARQFWSVHNWHAFCPQVYFMRAHKEVCTDFAGGARCVGCIPGFERAQLIAERLARAPLTIEGRAHDRECADERLNRPSGSMDERRAGLPTRVLRRVARELRSFVRVPEAAPPPAPSARTHQPPATPADPAQVFASEVDLTSADRAAMLLHAPMPLPSKSPSAKELRGRAAQVLAELDPPIRPGPGSPEWQPIENDATLEPAATSETIAPPGTPGHDYGRRRLAMVEAMNACDGVLAVSGFVRDKCVAMGVRPDLVRVQHIGSSMTRVVEWQERAMFEPPEVDATSPRPVRLVFLGAHNPAKGLDMLLDAIELLSPDAAAGLELSVYAHGIAPVEWRLRRLELRLARVRWRGQYDPHEIPSLLSGQDAGVVPSVWWDNGPQTVMEFLACGVAVVGARLGGVPDFVREGENGLLFRGNDREDLARALTRLSREVGLADRLRRGARATRVKGIEEHTAEALAMYAGGIAEDGAGEGGGVCSRPARAGGSASGSAGSSAGGAALEGSTWRR
ncbi:MAG: glycosyltransferase [Phycisphaerales bacterium]|nr:glycosyltransferase [Phycisphaerales bacterium]